MIYAICMYAICLWLWYVYDIYTFGMGYIMIEKVYMVVYTVNMVAKLQNYMIGWMDSHTHVWCDWLDGDGV